VEPNLECGVSSLLDVDDLADTESAMRKLNF